MDRKTKWRSFWLAILVALAAFTLMPSIVPSENLPIWFSKAFNKKIQLGLDLQGGLHVVYGIDLDRAVDDKATEIRRDLEAKMDELGIEGRVRTPRTPLGAVDIIVDDEASLKRIDSQFLSDYDEVIVPRECPEGPEAERAVCVRVSSDYAESIKDSALEQAIRTIRERINERGVAEPNVVRKHDQIIVELPGIDKNEISRVRELIERTAKLEFKIVDSGKEGQGTQFMKDLYAHVEQDPEAKERGIDVDIDLWTHDETGQRFRDYYLTASDQTRRLTREQAKEYGCYRKDLPEIDGKVDCEVSGRVILDEYLTDLAKENPKFQLDDDHQIGYELMTLKDPDTGEQNEVWRTYYMRRAVELGGSAITDANVYFSQTSNRPEVLVKFNRWGGRRFGELTGQNVGRKMAILLDNKINSAPIIQDKIDQGSSSISVGASDPQEMLAEANDLVDVLRTGSLPAPLREESSSEVGPLLGQDAINKAKTAFIVAAALVFFIMILYYRSSGVLALSALALNILFMMAILAGFQATLTLPGIAALVLTIGMAVDASIIIFERVREELRTGKSVKGAVDAGFSRGFSAILDGQITTAVAGYVLYQYGSGPIKGFAVMLMIGIVCTLFTATWCMRLFFEYYIGRRGKATVLGI